MSVKDLVSKMPRSGVFGAGRIAKAAEILKIMHKDRHCKVLFVLARIRFLET
ncbi:hypothetical protein GF345_02120 [Candidatus Woesearchaeota archaeon]|nr:hypothetical protein [Candidatus Woesearchaeota archaeon]